MKHYGEKDMAEFYFVLFKNNNEKSIHAWSDDKKLVNAYLEFHNCKQFEVKKRYAQIRDITEILNQNVHSEINIHNITIRDPKDKKGRSAIKVPIPATDSEIDFVRAEVNTALSSRIGYSEICDIFKSLKPKYQIALRDIYFPEIAAFAIRQKQSRFLQSVEMDELKILYMSFPDTFG